MIVRAEMPPLAARLRLIAWCSAPGLAAAVGSFRGWPARWVCLVIVIGVAVVAIARAKTGKPDPKPAPKGPLRDLLGFLLFGATIVFGFAALNAARPAVLGLVGAPTVATVGATDAEAKPTRSTRPKIDYCYHLLRTDGSEMTGRICRPTREYTRGQPLEVVAEPTGLIAPETPAVVADAALPRNIGLGAFALICLGALLGGGPAAPPPPPVPPSRYPIYRPQPRQLERRRRGQRQPRRGRRR